MTSELQLAGHQRLGQLRGRIRLLQCKLRLGAEDGQRLMVRPEEFDDRISPCKQLSSPNLFANVFNNRGPSHELCMAFMSALEICIAVLNSQVSLKPRQNQDIS